MRKYLVRRKGPLRGFQDVLEVAKSLEKQRASLEENPVKEAILTDLWVF